MNEAYRAQVWLMLDLLPLVALVNPVPEPSYRLVQEIQPGQSGRPGVGFDSRTWAIKRYAAMFDRDRFFALLESLGQTAVDRDELRPLCTLPVQIN